MALVLFLGAGAADDVPLLAPPFDKLAHFIYYGVMAALLAYAVGVRWLWLPLVLIPVIGAADEWHQASVAGRYPSAWDWLADFLGAVMFVYLYSRWTIRQRASK
jgi:VanZ family protein